MAARSPRRGLRDAPDQGVGDTRRGERKPRLGAAVQVGGSGRRRRHPASGRGGAAAAPEATAQCVDRAAVMVLGPITGLLLTDARFRTWFSRGRTARLPWRSAGADGAEAMKCRLTSSGGANQPPSGPPVDARLGPAAGRHELLPARPSGRRYRPARQRVWPTAGRPRPAAVGATRRRHRGPRSATGGPRRARGPAPPPPGRRASSRPSTSWVATASCPAAACRSSSIAFSRSGS